MTADVNPGDVAVDDPRTGEVIATVRPAGADEVRAAVAGAESARDEWSAAPVADRVAAVRALADAWTAASGDLVASIQRELGQPERFTRLVHVEGPLAGLGVLADQARDIEWERTIGGITIERMGLGVVGAITPWNYPLHQIVAKVGSALLAGCPVVVKPSELAPLSARVLAAAAEGRLPAGVLTFLEGDGSTGARLADDPGVDLVSFTGSPSIGRRVARATGARGAGSLLELGGKSPAVLLTDLDTDGFARACRFVVADSMSNAGQTCNALTRLVVPRSRLDEAIAATGAAAARFQPGGMLGPLRSASAVERVRTLVGEAEQRGAVLVADGRWSKVPEAGHWIGPTVMVVDEADHVAVTEIFGPVLCVVPYNDVPDDAPASDRAARHAAARSDYGLSAAVFSAEKGRAEAVGRGLRVSQIRINGAAWDHRAPFGGFGGSGFGREWGREGIEQYTTTRTTLR